MKQIKIEGATTDTRPDDKPSVCCFGEENTGKTRFLTTMPHDNGHIGVIALDKNCKRTVNKYQKELGLPVVINEKPFVLDKDLISLSAEEDTSKIKRIYGDAMKRIQDYSMRVVEHPDVESVAVDNGSQLFDYILFSHFGRRNQIESFQRGAPNQDMIDFISMMRRKNFLVINRSAEVWKDSGEVDGKGRAKQAPSGKMKPDGFGKIGGFMTAVLELQALRRKELTLDEKYRCKIVTCKGNTLMEGTDPGNEYGMCGEMITWDMLMTVIGVEE